MVRLLAYEIGDVALRHARSTAGETAPRAPGERRARMPRTPPGRAGERIVAQETYAKLNTSMGTIEVRLFPNHAPKTVENFVGLAEGTKEWKHPQTGEKGARKLYDGTIFHRVISGFMIQGGDPLGRGTGGPGYQFGDEIHPELAFTRPYLLAMANAGPGTNGSQFFITVAPTTWLTGKHTIFGEVTSGTEVVDAIADASTGPGDKPAKDIVIESVVIERRDA
jgi:peptidyl-prolyl cis-trans isomerase A (cyclophilin A)